MSYFLEMDKPTATKCVRPGKPHVYWAEPTASPRAQPALASCQREAGPEARKEPRVWRAACGRRPPPAHSSTDHCAIPPGTTAPGTLLGVSTRAAQARRPVCVHADTPTPKQHLKDV